MPQSTQGTADRDGEHDKDGGRLAIRLLIVSTNIFPVGGDQRYKGIERLALYAAVELARRGHEVSLTAPTGSMVPRSLTLIDTGKCGDFVISEWGGYYTYCSQLKEFDAILDYSHSHLAMRLHENLSALCFIWHDPKVMQPPVPSYGVCALSSWQAQRFQLAYNQKAHVLDCHCGPVGEPNPQGNGRFLFIGKMSPTKGARDAITLCKELNVGLDIVGTAGPGDPPEYLVKVKAESTGEIQYWGDVSDEVRKDLMESAEALIYPIAPNYFESHSHKMVDCLLHGLPCVTYDTGAFSEVIEDSVMGFLAVNREEFKAMMARVSELDREVIRDKAQARWSIEATVARLEAALESIKKGRT